GYLTVYPDQTARPPTSNLNFGAGQTVANLVVATLGANGQIDLFNTSGGTIQVIADVTGYFSGGGPTPGGFAPVTPARILDTRNPGRGPVAARTATTLTVAGRAGVPTMGANGPVAVVLNVTVSQPQTAGYLTVYPDQTARPPTSNLNFGAGQTVANLVVATLGANG